MMLSLDTAYRSFGGEVEASSTPTICRLSDSRRHQLSAIAPKDALAAAKRRGTKLGGDRGVVPSQKTRLLAIETLQQRANSRAADIAPIIADLQAGGAESLRAIADGLNEAGIPTPRGQGKWSAVQVHR